MTPPSYPFLGVTGLELEYAIVDQDLQVQVLVEDLLARLHGRPASEVEYRGAGFSNELAAHVFELKTLKPQESLVAAEARLQEGLAHALGVLREGFGARLLPTGMHPWMRPEETRIWRRAGRSIYQAYAQIFPIQDHGWLNVQSSHVNLPFGDSEETVALYNAVACLLPYLPALTANSPAFNGQFGPYVANRLAFYWLTQQRIPEITGAVVPEFLRELGDYQRQVLDPIYQALQQVPGGKRLCHEWVNSRGAILRFSRRALEIRILDIQECIRMDVAIAAFIRGVLRWLVPALREGSIELPDHRILVEDFRRVVIQGSRAQVVAPHLRIPATAGRRNLPARYILEGLLIRAAQETPDEEQPYLRLVEERLRRGNLSERIRFRARVHRRTSDTQRIAYLRGLYRELADCLEANRPWEG